MKRPLAVFALITCLFPVLHAQHRLSDDVNPFIGASTNPDKTDGSGLGKTFPGAATPFGMVQVSPNTITGGDNGSGYSDEHTSIEGFAFTQMSGVGWYGDLGNFLVMPSNGPLKTFAGSLQHPEEGYRSSFAKKNEQASAGYYAVYLDKYHIGVEATAAPHSGMLRFTFPKGEDSRIQIDLARRVGGTAVLEYVKVVNDQAIEGWMKCTPDGGGWGDGGGKPDYTVYFYAEFSRPMTTSGIWNADIPDDWPRHREDVQSPKYQERVAHAAVLPGLKEQQGKHLGFYAGFLTRDKEQVLLKAGISFVSMEGARNNLETEIKDWDFDGVHEKAAALWDAALNRITVKGGTAEDRKIFYTALYHSMIDPRCFADADGSYPGGDGNTHHAIGYTRRTIFSGWDVFRSEFPLQTLINPAVVKDMINSLVELARENGTHYLERWEFLNAYSGCMIGNPAVVVLADAYAKGIRGYDIETAYRYAVSSCERNGNGDRGYTPGSISATLEYAYNEWSLSRLAASLGRKEDSAKYARRAISYRNIFDSEKGWFRPKDESGNWLPWPEKGRLADGYGTVESNPYQQGWFVPHDVDGMVRLMGGRAKVIGDLENFFEKTPPDMMWNEYYNHANEPVHHVAYLFNRLGAPWLTQQWTREICRRAYHNTVEGLVGNDDAGQMSAWYVLTAIGLYPMCPGDNRFEITSPVFEEATIHLDDAYTKRPGTAFTVKAVHNNARNIYIQRAFLNGRPYDRSYIDYNDILAGGTLQLIMGPQPSAPAGVSGN